MEPEYLQDDLKAEVILILLQMDEDKLFALAGKNQLNFYAVRIIMNLIKSNTSPFYKKYRVINAHLDFFVTDGNKYDSDFLNRKTEATVSKNVCKQDMYDLKDREIFELLQDRAMEAIESLYWYDRELVKLYIKFGNYRAIEKDTGIPWESCYSTIRKSIKKIQCKLALPS